MAPRGTRGTATKPIARQGNGAGGASPLRLLERYPLDLEGLRKGDELAEADLVALLPDLAALDHDAYQWFLLTLRGKIEQHFAARGTPVYVKNDHRGLRILTDAEATAYLGREQVRHRRALRKNFLILAHVDAQQLSGDAKRAHERRLVVESRYLQAQEQVRKHPLPAAPVVPLPAPGRRRRRARKEVSRD